VARRSERIDALRGCAVFGILVVNVWSFVYGYAIYRYGLQDALPLADQLAVLFVAAFAEQKFYPIFAFLFGAGFALQTGRLPATPAYLRRLHWLLLVGLLHGTLIWFGDILTAYAVTGLLLVALAGRPLRELLGPLRLLVLVNLIILIGYGAVTAISHDAALEDIVAQVIDAHHAHAVYTQGSGGDIALARVGDFGWNLFGFFIFVPRLALLFLLGVFAVRLGWLTRPECHRVLWRRVLVVGLAAGIPLNSWWAVVALSEVVRPFAPLPGAGLAAALVDLSGPCLAAAYVAAFMLVRERLVRWLVPVGKMALTNYLTQSLVLSVLLQGFGLGAMLSRAQLLALCFGVMACQLLLCRWWLARYAQGPVEAAWRRFSRSR
jgi:uncharacterized protein